MRTSSAVSNGFARCAWYPATIARFRSSARANAVNAIAGTRRPFSSWLQIARIKWWISPLQLSAPCPSDWKRQNRSGDVPKVSYSGTHRYAATPAAAEPASGTTSSIGLRETQVASRRNRRRGASVSVGNNGRAHAAAHFVADVDVGDARHREQQALLTFWQQIPTVPRAICRRGISGHLCALACGGTVTEVPATSACILSMLRSKASSSSSSAGVSTVDAASPTRATRGSVTDIEGLYAAIPKPMRCGSRAPLSRERSQAATRLVNVAP